MTKSIRLTNQVREEILQKLLDKGFSAKKKEIEARRNELSIKVYNDVFSKKDRDLMQSLPQGWLPEISEMKVQFGGTSSGVCQREFQTPVRMPYKHVYSCSTNVLKVYEDSHKFTIEHDKITDDTKVFCSERVKAEAQTKAVLYSCNTTKALKEAWPEISSIVEAYEPAEGSQNETAIVPVANGLNSILGL
jgi:hypothetical protein